MLVIRRRGYVEEEFVMLLRLVKGAVLRLESTHHDHYPRLYHLP
jgi:hypothetical protein